jgi:DNA-binding MarR family transcriptional regulator
MAVLPHARTATDYRVDCGDASDCAPRSIPLYKKQLANNKLAHYIHIVTQTDHERSLGFLLNDVSRLMRQRFDERARNLGLTRAQWRVLRHLRQYEGIKQRSLAEMLEVETVTLGRHIDRLEVSGWVERRRDPADRRVWRLHLVEKSRPMIDRLTDLSAEVREFALTGFSKVDRDRLVESLLAMKGNLTSMNNGAGHDGQAAEFGNATSIKAKKANVG